MASEGGRMASKEFRPCEGSTTLGRLTGRGKFGRPLVDLDRRSLLCEGEEGMVAALVEGGATLGRGRRREGRGLRLSIIADESGRMIMKSNDGWNVGTRPDISSNGFTGNQVVINDDLPVKQGGTVTNGDGARVKEATMKDGRILGPPGSEAKKWRGGKKIGKSPERKTESCFLCGKPSTEQVRSRCNSKIVNWMQFES